MKTYKDYVREGIELVKQYKDMKYNICQLALRVCEIKIGGHGQSGVYSIKKFSEDIGINYNTVKGWLKEYQNIVVKLDKIPETKEERQAIRRILRSGGVTKASSPSFIQKLYKTQLSKSDEDRKLERHLDELNALTNFLCDTSIKSLNKKNIRKLENQLEKCMFLIYDKLTTKQKKAA